MVSPLHGRGRRIFFQTLALLVVVILCVGTCVDSPSRTVASFNIEEFPKSERQIDGAFDAIGGLEAGVVAVQEITDPELLRREAGRRLDGEWRAVFPDAETTLQPGVLFDTDRYRLDETRTHTQTVIYDGARPIFEVVLNDRRGGRLELFVVHLKAGSKGFDIRQQQHRALRSVLADRRDPSAQTVLLGDFNSTESEDRALLRKTASRTSLRWLSRRTECTGYWKPDDNCRSFDLDHVFADGAGARALSRGPCETVGCEPGDRCPTFHRRVSDHCPLTATLILRR